MERECVRRGARGARIAHSPRGARALRTRRERRPQPHAREVFNRPRALVTVELDVNITHRGANNGALRKRVLVRLRENQPVRRSRLFVEDVATSFAAVVRLPLRTRARGGGERGVAERRG